MASGPSHQATLLCWHSQGHGIAPLLDTLHLLPEQDARIQRVIYLLQSEAERELLAKVPRGIEVTAQLIKHRPQRHLHEDP